MSYRDYSLDVIVPLYVDIRYKLSVPEEIDITAAELEQLVIDAMHSGRSSILVMTGEDEDELNYREVELDIPDHDAVQQAINDGVVNIDLYDADVVVTRNASQTLPRNEDWTRE